MSGNSVNSDQTPNLFRPFCMNIKGKYGSYFKLNVWADTLLLLFRCKIPDDICRLFFCFFFYINYRLERSLYVKLKYGMSNSVDPNETAHDEPSHLDLCCLQKPIIIACAAKEFTFTTLSANSADNELMILTLLFSENSIWYSMQIVSTGPLETIYMKCQNPFSWKSKKIFQNVVC